MYIYTLDKLKTTFTLDFKPRIGKLACREPIAPRSTCFLLLLMKHAFCCRQGRENIRA